MDQPEKIPPDDPRLTAYALGELEAEERAVIERVLRHDAVARAQVEEIRTAMDTLGAALAAEEAPAATVTVPAPPAGEPPLRAKILRFPQLYFTAAGLAAACFGIYFVLHEAGQLPGGADPAQTVRHVAAERPAVTAAADAADRESSMRAAAPAPVAAKIQLVSVEPGLSEQFFSTGEHGSSVFPLRLGRGSLAAVRDQLRRGIRPARPLVHVAEMINGFNYQWPEPEAGEPLAVLLEETAAPWTPEHRLVRVGVKGAGRSGAVAALNASVRVDFNPDRVQAWRLVGFERDEAAAGVRGRDRGETIRGGETVTALYEILPAVGGPAEDPSLLRLRLTYRDETSGAERELVRRLPAGRGAFAAASRDMKFIAAVAAFGLELRESPLRVPADLGTIAEWAEAGAGGDPERQEFADLVRRLPR